MSDAAVRRRADQQRWANPGSAHDKIVRWSKILLPAGVGALIAILAFAPLQKEGDVSLLIARRNDHREIARRAGHRVAGNGDGRLGDCTSQVGTRFDPVHSAGLEHGDTHGSPSNHLRSRPTACGRSPRR